jgi:hypothetical protein
MTEKPYKGLAAAVLQLAVLDMRSMFKKTMRLSALSAGGKLRAYVYRALDGGREQDITFTPDEVSAMRFWENESRYRELYFDLLDIPEIPKEIKQQRDYCLENYGGIQAKLVGLRGSWKRKTMRLNHCD